MTTSPVPYSRQVKLNFPNKVLNTSVSNSVGTEYWPYANGDNDPWYEGSFSKKFYRWELELTIQPQQHGSHLTRDDFEYNGLDVIIGDWIAGATDGKCMRIVSISLKTKTFVRCVVEDYLRYNTFKTPGGNGLFQGSAAVIFSLNEEGFPILDPMPTNTSPDFFTLVASRFQYLNPQTNYLLREPNHGFKKGEVISVTASGYVKANAITADTMIGVVTESGPGPDFFMFLPNNRIYDFDPGIPGVQGDYIYVDDQGNLSNVSATTKRAIFLNLKNSVPTVLSGNVGNPVILNGNTVVFNSVGVTFSGAGGSANVFEMASSINEFTDDHFVTAQVVPFPNTITSNAANTAFGLVGGFVPFSAYLDTGSSNTLITFTTAGSSFAGVASPLDMKVDIQAAAIANLSVTANENDLTLSELNGNSITITNVSADTGGTNFAGPLSITGFNLANPGTSANKLELIRSDGGEILIYEDSDIFQNATGIFSGHNGSLPLAMNIEQGVRTGGIYVVADVAARNGLVPIAGDQAYVINKGFGEWALYQYTGSAWVEISNQDSAATDARTLVTTFTLPIAGSTATAQNIGNVSPGRKIVGVTVDVLEPLSNASQSPTLLVGTLEQPSQFLSGPETDLTDTATFSVSPEYLYPANSTSEMTLRATLNHYNATSGIVTVKVTYV
jgi:hypothetical protein